MVLNEPLFFQILSYGHSCRNGLTDDGDTIRDIFDGQEYKKFVHSGFLSQANKANVSFMMNTDGVDLYQSSKYSVWPIWLQLPPTQRYTHVHVHMSYKVCACVCVCVQSCIVCVGKHVVMQISTY